MPSFADWARADIIAALALAVSILAFVASAVSSLVSWRSYLATQAARRPKLHVYFEPFVDSEVWWIANFRLANRSEHVLRFERIRVTRPYGVAFSSWLGGWVGGGSGGGPMNYDLPDEVHSRPTVKELTKVFDDEDDMDFEIGPSNENMALGELIVKTPRWRISRNVSFRIDFIQLSEVHRRVSFRVQAPYPSRQNTKPRH